MKKIVNKHHTVLRETVQESYELKQQIRRIKMLNEIKELVNKGYIVLNETAQELNELNEMISLVKDDQFYFNEDEGVTFEEVKEFELENLKQQIIVKEEDIQPLLKAVRAVEFVKEHLLSILNPLSVEYSAKSESIYMKYNTSDIDKLFDNVNWNYLKNFEQFVEDEDLGETFEIRISGHEVGSRRNRYTNMEEDYSNSDINIIVGG